MSGQKYDLWETVGSGCVQLAVGRDWESGNSGMSDEDDETTTDENACPFCASTDGCGHLLLLVDLTFRTSVGGALFEAFGDRWSKILEQEDDDFDEAEAFSDLLEEVDFLSDASLEYDIDGVPGRSSQYGMYFSSSTERVLAAVSKFETASSARVDVDEAEYEREVPDIIMSASKNAFLLSWDSFGGEELVFGRVIEVLCLTKNGSNSYLKSIGLDPKSEPSTVVQIVHEVWVIPADFAPENPQSLIYRRCQVVVDADELVNNRLVTRGMGPEYDYFEWVQLAEETGSLDDVDFPAEEVDMLAEMISSLHAENIVEFLKEGGEMPANLSTPVLNAYKGLSEIARSQLASEEREYAIWEAAEVARQNEDKLPFAELIFDVNVMMGPIHNRLDPPKGDSRRRVLALPSIHKSRWLYIFARPLLGVEGGWTIEACIVRKSQGGTMFYAEQAKEKFDIFLGTSNDDLENAIIAQIKDGSMAQRFRKIS